MQVELGIRLLVLACFVVGVIFGRGARRKEGYFIELREGFH